MTAGHQLVRSRRANILAAGEELGAVTLELLLQQLLVALGAGILLVHLPEWLLLVALDEVVVEALVLLHLPIVRLVGLLIDGALVATVGVGLSLAAQDEVTLLLVGHRREVSAAILDLLLQGLHQLHIVGHPRLLLPGQRGLLELLALLLVRRSELLLGQEVLMLPLLELLLMLKVGVQALDRTRLV